MEPTYFDALAVLATLLGSLIVYYVTLKRSTAPLPPGPKKLPILGNLFNFPQTNPHIVYTLLAQDYLRSAKILQRYY